MSIPDAVRELAEHPFRELPLPPSFARVEAEGAAVVIMPAPIAQVVEPAGVDVAGIPRAVEAMRAAARERGKGVLVWWIAPEHDHLAPALEELGLVHEDTPGFESVENAMALVTPPDDEGLESVEVRQVASLDEYAAASRVSGEVFGMTAKARAEVEATLPQRYEESRHPASPRSFVALVDGRVVGSGAAALADAGINLFGGAVLPEARGRGVYRALTVARWQFAVERGTPALTIQAGRMAKPIVERLGFVQVSAVRLFVDAVA